MNIRQDIIIEDTLANLGDDRFSGYPNVGFRVVRVDL